MSAGGYVQLEGGSRFFSSVPSEGEEIQYKLAHDKFSNGTAAYAVGALCYYAPPLLSIESGRKEVLLFKFFASFFKGISGAYFLESSWEARKVDRVMARHLKVQSLVSVAYIIASEILMANLTPSKNPHYDQTILRVLLHSTIMVANCYISSRRGSLVSEQERIEFP